MTIGGGLHDDDRRPVHAPTQEGIRRERFFWILMIVGVWAAMQGWPQPVMVVLAPVLAIGVVMVLSRSETRSWYR